MTMNLLVVNITGSESYLREKLDQITEPSPWYTTDQSPWGAAILPPEFLFDLVQPCPLITQIAHCETHIRSCEIRTYWGPITYGQYTVQHEVLGISGNTVWIESSLQDHSSGDLIVEVIVVYEIDKLPQSSL